MRAEIISIGDELLIGQTINTNAAWLGEKLNANGIRVHRSTSIADDRTDILTSLGEAGGRSQLILITGGLGPTKDDITKKTMCEYFETDLIMNEAGLARITEFFTSRGLPMLEVNHQQALVPRNCTVIQNLRGTADGMWFEKDGVVYVSMPGVPYEMENMMEETILDKVLTHFKRPSIVHRTILTTGLGESFLADKIKDWENSLAGLGIGLAYLPSPGMVKLRMSVYGGGDEASLRSKIEAKEKELLEIIPGHVYGYEKDTLQGVTGTLLLEQRSSLSVAESCTGGYLSHLITSVPGSSAYFKGGGVTYVSELKERVLGVNPDLIAKHGEISSQVAEAMAIGAQQSFMTDYALSVTGIAGPTGGTEETPVGMVWIAVASPGKVRSELFRFGKRREFNIQMAANAALNMLRKEILS